MSCSQDVQKYYRCMDSCLLLVIGKLFYAIPFECTESVSCSVVSLLQSYGLQPARLLCPLDSASKNTGLSFSPPGGLPNPGVEPGSPALQANS